MRRRNVKNAHERVQARSGLMVLNPTDYKGKWRELFGNNNEWKIYSEDTYGFPQFIGADAHVDNSIVNQGCNILGDVKDSVLFSIGI